MVVRGSLFGCTCSTSTLDRLYVCGGSVDSIGGAVVSVFMCVVCVYVHVTPRMQMIDVLQMFLVSDYVSAFSNKMD